VAARGVRERRGACVGGGGGSVGAGEVGGEDGFGGGDGRPGPAGLFAVVRGFLLRMLI
jgi:hypothetical protein